MIIDINATIGHYPFRQLAARTGAEMIAMMDRWSIDRAVVSSLHSVFYRDAHRGNSELLAETQPYGDRFICVATVNPKYAGWQADLEQAVQHMKMRAVTLVPAHHGYSLTDQYGRAALDEIARLELPVLLTQRFEDRRQRHHWDVAEDLEVSTLLEIARQHKELRFVLSNWIGLDGPRLLAAGLKGRCLIDWARMHVLLNKDVPKLIDALGIESVAFGSHMPFDYVAPSLVKLANLDTLSVEDQERVAWRNAAQFFKLK
ncbi:MAG: amidohydrolase family protein [Pirellulaceae bacterium]|nr:amidohydrolase family protein [Pirellulaceae bacterium]